MSNLFDHSNPFNKPNPYRGNYQHSITNRLDNSRRMINQQRIISNIPSHKLHDNIWQFNEDNLSKQSLFHDNPGRRRIGSEYSSKISIGNGLSSYGKN